MVHESDRFRPPGDKPDPVSVFGVSETPARNRVGVRNPVHRLSAPRPSLTPMTSTQTPVGALIGYARVSTHGQDPALQIDALTAAGAIRVFTDIASGAKDARPGLADALEYARPGDVLGVWKLDRLGRSLRHLIDQVQILDQNGIGFRSLTESIDTTSPGGRMIFHLFAALAEFERDLIVERTNAGLANARAQGRIGGRPTVMTPEKITQAQALLALGHSRSSIARTLGIGRATLNRALHSS